MTNSDFLAEVHGELAPDQYGWVCSFRASPDNPPEGVWAGRAYRGTEQQAKLIDGASADNTYFSTAILTGFPWARQKATFHALAALVVDDIDPADVMQYSWALQTSPGKYQVGILLDWRDDPDCSNQELVDRIMVALASRGRSNDRSGNACVRYVRLPGGTNTKPRAAGPWKVQLAEWHPNVRWTLADACAAVGIDLDALRVASAVAATAPTTSSTGSHAGEMLAMLTAPVSERSYHDSLARLAASLVSGGMYAGAAVELLYSLMDQVRPTGPAEEVRRWEMRRAEIPRAVKSAEKFAPENRQPRSVTVNLAVGDDVQKMDTPAQPGALTPLDWDSLGDREPEPAHFHVPGWLPARTTTILSANGGVGKSNLSLQLAVGLATGHAWLGMELQPCRVLVISAEDDTRTVHFRVANICRDLKVGMLELKDRLAVYDMTDQDCVLWRAGGATDKMQWLADAAVRHRAQVVIIDNASDVFAANENDRAEVRGFMRCLNAIAHGTGAAVLLLAHVDKASVRMGAGQDTNTTFSGSTAWNNSARSRWAMTRDGERVISLRHEKCNLGPLQDEVRLEFDIEAKVFRRFGTTPGASAAAALVRNTNRAAILRLLVSAERAGQRLSMNASANNNAYRVLKSEAEFPRVERSEFFSLLFQMQRDGLLEEVEYKHDRKNFKRLQLTDVGKLRAAQGSGAPAMWRGSGSEGDE